MRKNEEGAVCVFHVLLIFDQSSIFQQIYLYKNLPPPVLRILALYYRQIVDIGLIYQIYLLGAFTKDRVPCIIFLIHSVQELVSGGHLLNMAPNLH